MQKARITINREFKKGSVDDRIYGSFVEHMGRVVYSGIYEPDHPLADEDGFRKDVLEAVRNAGITTIRYPGGNFVSCYNWEDGIGPKEERPRRPELAWKAVETNEFGTDEFMKWCEKAGVSPMLAVNLGTGSIREALHYLEYCNFKEGTTYSEKRKRNGREEPYRVRTWCLGNEMDGEWQLGHKGASEYGRLVRETAKAMKILDPGVELVSCGSSLNTMATFPEWEAQSLDETYEYVDYISLHQYFDGHEKPVESFLAQADEMSDYIRTVTSVCDYIKAKKRSSRQLSISFDEWGVWTRASKETVRECDESPWQQAMPISEMVYSFQDALLFGGMLLAILKHADRVKIACQSLLTNVSAMIMTEKGGGVWLQPIYYPFADTAAYGHGHVMDCRVTSDSVLYEKKEIPLLDMAAVENGEEMVVFMINRSPSEEMEVSLDLQGYEAEAVLEHRVLTSDDPEAVNSPGHQPVRPEQKDDAAIKDGTVAVMLDRLSWNVLRIKVK